MDTRMAQERDVARMGELLLQVAGVHHEGRPDLFKGGARKYTDDELREMLRDPMRPIIAAVDEDDVMQGYAFCVFEITRNDNVRCDMKTLYVDDICIEEGLRGQHIGSLIFASVREFAARNGCQRITLNVWECNPGARKFYEAMGMVPFKTGMELIL